MTPAKTKPAPDDTETPKDEAKKDDDLGLTDAQKSYIGSVVRRERRRHEQELAALLDKNGPGDDQGAGKGDPDPKDDSAGVQTEIQQLRRELAEERAGREQDKLVGRAVEVAIAAGVNPKRAATLVRLASLDDGLAGIKASDTERLEGAIADTIETYPEFKAAVKSDPKDDAGEQDKGKQDTANRPASSSRDDSGDAPPNPKNENVGAGPARLRAAYADSGAQG